MKAMRVAGWVCAAMVVLGGHGAAALWVMQTRADPPPPGQPVFVDLAPPPPAPDFSVPASGLVLSGPPIIPPAPPLPNFALPALPVQPLPPLTGIAEAVPPEVGMPPIAPPAFDAAALPPTISAERPVARPVRRAPPREPESAPRPEAPQKTATADKRPQPQKAESASARNRSTASAAAERPAPQASGAGKGAGVKAQASWRAVASAAVARHMQRGRYNTQGPVSATISLSVDGSGRITGASASSGMGGSLDAALTRQIHRLGRLPAPPGGRPLPVVVPVKIVH